MANNKQAITSLLTEHFTYTPLTLIDDIINTVNELVYRAVTAVEEGLTSAPAESLGFAEKAASENRDILRDAKGNAQFPEARLEIQDGVHKLETLLEATVDKNFDKLELYVLRNILNIPEDLAPYIQLDHYKGLDFSVQDSNKNNNVGPEDLVSLRRKLQETRRLHNALESEHKRNAQLITQLTGLLTPPDQAQTANDSSNPSSEPRPANLSFLSCDPNAKSLGLDTAATSASSGSQMKPLSEHAQFLASQLPALKELLAILKPKVDQLNKVHTDEMSEERREYIEGQAKRLLESRGIDTETGDGLARSAQVTGRQVSADEVAAIEAIAKSLGKQG